MSAHLATSRVRCLFLLNLNWLPLLVTLQLFLFQRQVCRLPHSAAMVAREGAAPPISGCRPDVILFHHRAVELDLPKLAAGHGLAPPRSPSKGDVLLIRRPGNEMVTRQGNAPRSTD